jgi:phospho-N-acetylmuramoyl-pentapeptide-transferase
VIRLLLAAAVAIVASLLGTSFLIKVLTRYRIGQPIREEGPEGHVTKAGTPTMGGLAIVGSAIAGYLISDIYRGIYTRTGMLVMLAIAAAGFVGLLDDWLKVSRERNLGLTKTTKSIGLLVVAVGWSWLIVAFTAPHTTLSFTRYDYLGLDMGTGGWMVMSVFVILASTNAVNLTDGLDGLAGGSAILAFAAFVVIGFWCFSNPDVYRIDHALDIAVVSSAMLGGCIGFLWWNAPPARIFMGDTGALAIGAALACLALSLDTVLLLPLIGGLYVAEAVSVMIQVASFRFLGGRRIFRMAPLHHHFELAGWPETTVIIRFWLIAGLCAALALGLYYADFVGRSGVLR